MSDSQQPTCVSCGRTSQEIPLIPLDYREQKYWICPQDLPKLIHRPQDLIGMLPGAENLRPGEH